MNKKYDFTILFLNSFAPSTLGISKISYHLQHEIYNELIKYCNVILSNKLDDIRMNQKDINYIFSLFNKSYYKNTEVCISSIAEYYNIPYFGAQNNIRAIAEDRHLLKIIADYTNVPTRKWQVCKTSDVIGCLDLEMDPPYIINTKNRNKSCVERPQILLSRIDAVNKIKELSSKGIDTIVESYIEGDFYTVPVSWDSGSIKIYPSLKCNFNNVEHKPNDILEPMIWNSTNAFTHIIYEINDDEVLHEQLKKFTKRLFNLLEPTDTAQFNFMVDKTENKIYFLDMDVCCSLSRNSAFAISANHAGYTYEELFKTLLFGSLRRQNLID